MSYRVSDILTQKISEIQSRVPLRMNNTTSVPFQQYLDTAIDTASTENNTQTASPSDNIQTNNTIGENAINLSTDNSVLMKLIESSVAQASAKYNLDPNLIKAVIKQESGYNPYSLSRSGAQGLMQLMPGTAGSLGVADPWDVAQNIDGGARYLRTQLDNFNGDVRLALAAYNAGPNSVTKYNGVPPYIETQNYVSRVMEYYRQLSNQK